MTKKRNRAEQIEVVEPIIVKPKKEEKIKATPKEDIGTYKGKPRYKKGVEYRFTKEQIENYKLNNLI